MKTLALSKMMIGAALALTGWACMPLGLAAQAPNAAGNGDAQPKKFVCIMNGDTVISNVMGAEDIKVSGLEGEQEMKMVIVRKEISSEGAGGAVEGTEPHAVIRTIKIMNGDTVIDMIEGDPAVLIVEDGKLPELEDIRIQMNEGAGKHIIIVRVKEIQLEDLEGEEASKFAPRKNESLNLKDLEYFPNPNEGRFTLRFRLRDKQTPAAVRIMTLEGQEVYTDSVPAGQTQYEKDIDLGEIPGGVYLLSVTQGEQKLVKRLVIQ